MEANLKGNLKAIVLKLRRLLEGYYDAQGNWQAGDLERRLAAIGVRRNRPPVPVDELPHLSPEDRDARRVVDAFLKSRAEAGLDRGAAISEFVAKSAYTWANRLLALRCMEARGLIDEVILQKEAYGGRSLQHNRLVRKEPGRCTGEDEGLFAVLFDEFERRAKELPLLFNPKAPEVALRPSVAAIKQCIRLLSGTEVAGGQDVATEELFTAPDALGWAYQYWNSDQKDKVFEKVRTKKGAKIEGAEIIPATCIYTEPYIVKFLVQNSLGALWCGMHPDSRLVDKWEYYVREADRAPVQRKPVREITFLDPACGSGHFLIEAFDLFYAMYQEEGDITAPAEICAAILERNLYGIDIDERAVQIAAIALVMKAKEKAPDFVPRRVNLVATNIRLPSGKDHLEALLRKHPDDTQLTPALMTILDGLAHADELGSLLQIEEPVEKELRLVAKRYPLLHTGHDWQGRKLEVIDRLRQHFDAEVQEPDLVQALFGEAGAKGLSLIEVLSRRYDVVAANPPYMGSKNMGAVLKRHVERHFPAGKRDLYAAFILRCLELATIGGRVAMVTQQSWMFLRSFAQLRATNEEKIRDAPRTFTGLLRETSLETIAHLGPRAFTEIGGEVVNTAMFVLSRTEPAEDHRLTAFRLVGPKSPEEKDAFLQQAIRNGGAGAVFRPLQARFLAIPQAPLCYWLRERFFELLSGRTLGDVADVCQGLATANDARFVRFVWEVPLEEWRRPVRRRRWVPFEKGGGYGKWFGHHFWAVDWEQDGARIRATPGPRVQNEQHYFKEGWTYSITSGGCVGFRLLSDAIFSTQSAGVILHKPELVASLESCRFASAMVRAMTAQMYIRESYVSHVPVPEYVPGLLRQLESSCIASKQWIVGTNLLERSYQYLAPAASSLTEAWRSAADRDEAVAAVLHTLEGLSEREVFKAYGIAGDDLQAVLDETGTPAGWFPLIKGYDTLPELPFGLAVPAELLAPLAGEMRRSVSAEELDALRRRLRALYKAGPGAKLEEEEAATDEEDEGDESEAAVSGARIPIPAETFLEELSQKLEVHPISVYWLLRELRETEGVVCQPELQRFVEDYVSITVLRLLGHRWPKQIEADEPPPSWADCDGIIPLTEGTGELTLLERVRERIAEDFGAGQVNAIEQEFEQIIGRPLGPWLATAFFPRHVSQFKNRPIAWQIESSRNNGRRGRRGKANAPAAFACLVYYHRLDSDLLPKLRSQYVGPLRTRFQTELAGLERLDTRTVDQDERRVQLEMLIEELKDFDARLEQVITAGFSSPALDAVAKKEPLDQWTSRNGGSQPTTREAFLAQERKYDPDLNDGVRVNVAPLQRAGLLAADVLAAKDVEKAIADRAEWRADERRWCREGKLPQPGWWSSVPARGACAELRREDVGI